MIITFIKNLQDFTKGILQWFIDFFKYIGSDKE